MRGKAEGGAGSGCCRRITPAYAGKRHFLRNIRRHNWDHPRLCGEKRKLYASGYSYTGSPPPMRGKVFGCPALTHKSRITPAYAGKSKQSFLDLLCIRDHPRLCGEKFRCRFSRIPLRGSPPPMRGKANANLNHLPPSRITPAYAGKS